MSGEGVPDDDFWRWASQLVRGVADIHGSGVIHLAIKPEIIRLTDDTHEVRIGGFQNACDATLAAAHILRPTDKPEYRSPDQVHSFASDVFSVGVTLFEMATGELPLPGRDARVIEDPAKRELVSFALRDELSERPTAEALLEKTLELVRGVEGGAPSNAVRVGDGWAYTEEKE